jgi:ABC-type lipoprotein release transport system permease subunit
MLAAGLLIGIALAIVVLSLLWTFRQERLRLSQGDGQLNPRLPLYRFLAVIILVFVAYSVVMAITTALMPPGGAGSN